MLIRQNLVFQAILILASSTLLATGAAQAQESGKARCDRGPASLALDFWIGRWRVTNELGSEVGESEITHVSGTCAVLERFHGADGEGVSLATYNTDLQRWERLFTNTSGWIARQTGEAGPGSVYFLGTLYRPDGSRPLLRTTLFPADRDRVRQIVQISYDNGQAWHQLGVAVYERR